MSAAAKHSETLEPSSEVVLIVDDDQPLREAMRETLLLGGYESVAVGSADEAMSILDSTPVSLPLRNVWMQQLFQLTRKLLPEQRATPVVAYVSRP